MTRVLPIYMGKYRAGQGFQHFPNQNSGIAATMHGMPIAAAVCAMAFILPKKKRKIWRDKWLHESCHHRHHHCTVHFAGQPTEIRLSSRKHHWPGLSCTNLGGPLRIAWEERESELEESWGQISVSGFPCENAWNCPLSQLKIVFAPNKQTALTIPFLSKEQFHWT